MFYVDFTYGDRVERIAETPDKSEAIEKAQQTQLTKREAKQTGVISVYTISTERGAPMRKVFEFYEV